MKIIKAAREQGRLQNLNMQQRATCLRVFIYSMIVHSPGAQLHKSFYFFLL